MFDKDEQEISQLIETGLEAVLSGRMTLEQFLAQHPEQAPAVRPELESAMWLVSRRQEMGPRPGFVQASRRRVVDRIVNESKGRDAKRAFLGIAWPRQLMYQWAATAAILLVLFSSAGGMVSASQETLPGDVLYSVKRVSETVAYTFTFNDTRRVHLSAQFAERRLDEVTALADQGKYREAEQTLKEFKQQINQTVVLLESTSSNMSVDEAKELAEDLKVELLEQVDTLEFLRAGDLSDGAIGGLDDAASVILFSVNVTDDLLDGELDGEEPTPTALPTYTPTYVTPTPAATATPVPSDTTEVEDNPAPEEGADTPDSIATPGSNTRVTKTPKPTNENRPANPNPANPSGDNPGKPEKPDKSGKDN